MLMGIWRVTGSTRLHNLAVRSMIVLNSTPSGNKLVGIPNRMGVKFASKLLARWWSNPSCLNCSCLNTSWLRVCSDKGAGFIDTNIGSNGRLVQHNL
eukprot:846244-Pelagomonas_calceolata.AAC.2